MSTPIRLGIIGCGWAGQQAVHAAVALPGIEVTAIADLEESLRQATLTAHPKIPHQHGPYQDLLHNPAVDAVYLAVNPAMRYPMVLDAIAAGKHLLVQKPHAVRADHVREFASAADAAGVTLQFCYFMRHFPLNRALRERIRAAAIHGDKDQRTRDEALGQFKNGMIQATAVSLSRVEISLFFSLPLVRWNTSIP